jgi:hypothetical protein
VLPILRAQRSGHIVNISAAAVIPRFSDPSPALLERAAG